MVDDSRNSLRISITIQSDGLKNKEKNVSTRTIILTNYTLHPLSHPKLLTGSSSSYFELSNY